MVSDNDEVGYRKPPKNHQFKPGESGNRKGRPRRTKDVGTLFDQGLNRLVPVKRGEKIVRIPMREFIVSQIINSAAKGDPRARDFVFKYMIEGGKSDLIDAKPYDDEILAEFVASLAVPDDDKPEDG